MDYRANGRATQFEERILRKRDKIDQTASIVVDDATTPEQKYAQLQSLFDEYGWAAFDKSQAKLWDDLQATYGGAVIDRGRDGAFHRSSFETKPSTLARRDADSLKAYDRSNRILDRILGGWEAGRNVDGGLKSTNRYQARNADTWMPPKGDGWLLNGHRYRRCSVEVLDAAREPRKTASDNDNLEDTLSYRRTLNEWRTNYPEKDFPDWRRNGTGLISSEWMPPRNSRPTRHSALAKELQSLLHLRNSESSNEPLQTNIFGGDNDNFVRAEEGDVSVDRSIECALGIRPTENEMMNTIKVAYLEQTAFPDVSFEDRRMPSITGLANPNDFIGPRQSRRVPVRGYGSDDTGKILARGGDVEWDNRGNLKRMAHLRFGTAFHERTKPHSDFLGEITDYRSSNGWHSANDEAGKPRGSGPKAVTKLNSLFDKELGAKPSNSNVAKWNSAERRERENKAVARWKNLFEDRHGRTFEGSNSDLRRNKLDQLPALPPATMPLGRARDFCGLSPKPANDNAVSFGLPRGVTSAAHLSMAAAAIQPSKKAGLASKAQTDEAVHGHSPEAALLRNEDRNMFSRARSMLADNENEAIDAFFRAENFAQVGRETGDQDKHHRTQERNGQERVMQAATKLSAIREQIAA